MAASPPHDSDLNARELRRTWEGWSPLSETSADLGGSSAPDITLPPEEAGTAPAACPRCGGALIDPAGLGWCKACGYCHSLAGERNQAPPRRSQGPSRPSALGAVEFFMLLVRMPTWLWPLLAGVGLAVGLSLVPLLAWPADSFARCLWCTCQLGMGLVLLLVGQFWALLVVAADDERLSFKDGIFSGRLWIVTARQLPRTRRQFTFGVWGLTTILCAFLLVGSLTHWLTYLPGHRAANPPAAERVG